MNDRTPPQDLEAEQAVLGSMLTSSEAIDEAMALLGESDFYRPQHGQVWDAIVHLYEKRVPVAPATVKDELEKRGHLERLGGAPYLHTLYSQAPVAASGGYYAEIVAEKSRLRRIIDAASRAQQAVYEGGSAEDILQRQETELAGVPQRVSDGSRWADMFPRALDALDSTDPPGLSLPWPSLDKEIHGLRPGWVYLVAARPSVGKSLMGQGIATHVAEHHNKAALFFSLEMSQEDLTYRIWADKASIPLSHLIDHNINEFEDVKLAELHRRSADWPLTVYDQPDQTFAQIRATVRSHMHQEDVGVVVIDYLGLIQPRDSRVNREQQVAEISRGLKVLAREFKVPVVALVQLNRGPEQRQDKQPMLSDMRDSGSQEQDADVALLLWRPQNEPWTLNVFVGKNRHGQQPTVTLNLMGHFARLQEAS